jgi:hypothetical protein
LYNVNTIAAMDLVLVADVWRVMAKRNIAMDAAGSHDPDRGGWTA